VSSFREHRYTTQDGLSLYYREYGDPLSTETPFLCLPGLARNSKDFHRVATRLSADRWVICPDYRGRGQSDYDPEPDNYQPTTYLQDIRHLLVVTGMHRAVVIGTSMGGLLATGLGVVAPSLLAGVVLNDIGPHIEDNGIGRIIDYLGIDHPHPDWDHAVAAFKGRFPTLSFDTEGLWREGAEATWREREDGQLHVDWDVNIVLPMVQNKELPDLWALFRSLRNVPILAIRGGVSDVLSAETFDRMADEHPKLDRLCLEGVGHVPSLIEPESTEAIDRLLAQI
jgi:pimeloyl-ACP methyl ester carboxylesterase